MLTRGRSSISVPQNSSAKWRQWVGCTCGSQQGDCPAGPLLFALQVHGLWFALVWDESRKWDGSVRRDTANATVSHLRVRQRLWNMKILNLSIYHSLISIRISIYARIVMKKIPKTSSQGCGNRSLHILRVHGDSVEHVRAPLVCTFRIQRNTRRDG